MYIQRHGKVPEATAKHFMLQLGMFHLFIACVFLLCSSGNKGEFCVTAAGLQVLRDNNLIHRDLKPQVS